MAYTADQHPPAEVMAAFFEGTLFTEERERVIEHIAGCSDCCSVLAGSVLCEIDLENDPQPQEAPMPPFTNPQKLVTGDRVETSTGKIVRGRIHHFNDLGQAYVDGAERGGPSYLDPAILHLVPADVAVTKREELALTVPVATFVADVEELLAHLEVTLAGPPLQGARGQERLEVAIDKVRRDLTTSPITGGGNG